MGPPGYRHGQRRGGPPPWWPAAEPWPPPGGWRSVRRRFVRRIGLLLIGFVALLIAVSLIWGAVFAPHVGWRGGHPPPNAHYFPWLPVLALMVIAALLVARTLRRTAAPIGDVMDAAGRLASGDYAARVEPRGSGEVRRLAESFNEMAGRLQADEEQRQALLAEIAHELRTPLSVMHGDIEGMLDGVYERDDERLGTLLAGTQRMTRLLEDLQTLSTAQAGALRLHRERVDVRRLVDEVRDAFAPPAAERGVALTSSAGDVPPVDADPVRLRQVLDNLVTNALRFTPAGGSVTIAAGGDTRSVTMSVSDTGIGIPDDQLSHLFERFSKSGDSKGSGLGLAIARSLVEAHGGSIDARSEVGRGTTISFRIPATPA